MFSRKTSLVTFLCLASVQVWFPAGFHHFMRTLKGWQREREKQREGESDRGGLGRRIFPVITMKAALSSTSCFLSCLRHSPGDTDGDRGGSALSLQTPGLHSDSSKPQSVCRMSEGDVTVLPFGPASLDLSRQEPRTLTRLYSRNGGYHLRILADGTVNGGRQENDPYGEKGMYETDVWLAVWESMLTTEKIQMKVIIFCTSHLLSLDWWLKVFRVERVFRVSIRRNVKAHEWVNNYLNKVAEVLVNNNLLLNTLRPAGLRRAEVSFSKKWWLRCV